MIGGQIPSTHVNARYLKGRCRGGGPQGKLANRLPNL